MNDLADIIADFARISEILRQRPGERMLAAVRRLVAENERLRAEVRALRGTANRPD